VTEPTAEDREYLPEIAGNGDVMGTLKTVWANFRDDSCIAQYLSPNLMRKMRLFKLADQSEAPHYLVDAIHDERGYARVRRALARQYDPGERDPNIQVSDVDLKGSRRLVLTHNLHNDVPLAEDNARAVLGYVADLWGYDVQLLGIGLPLTIVLGWVLALWLVSGLDVWLALLVAAALAPTDAALGVPVVTNPTVPSRVRRLITVESGLNDGIATPVVMVAIAGAASAEGLAEGHGVGTALVELAVGVVVGVALGAAGGGLLQWARRRGWSAEDFAGVAVLALALGSYLGAITVGGNGFVAAFCAGLAFGAAAGRRGPAEVVFLEQVSGLVSLLVWAAFGVIAVPIMLNGLTVTIVVYAVLSLTLVRMLPVALALIGAGLDRRSVAFIGWFGPRGLASLVFALIAVEELGPQADAAVAGQHGDPVGAVSRVSAVPASRR